MSGAVGGQVAAAPAPPAAGGGRRGGVAAALAGAAAGPRLAWVLAGVAFVVCTAGAGAYPTEWDSVQLVLGLDDFDVTRDSPHPPGYWLYVAAARVVRALTPLSGLRSLQLLAALATAATVGLTVVLGRRVGGAWLGAAAGAFVLTSPFTLFYGAMPASYAFDSALAVTLVLLALAARPGTGHALAAAALLGLGAGFRQTSLVVLAPVVAWAAVRSVRSVRAALAAAGAGALGVAVWFVPMLAEQPGGWSRYRAYSAEYLSNALSGTSPLHGAPGDLVARNALEGLGYTFVAVAGLLPLAAAGLVVAVAGRRRAGDRPGPGPSREAVVLLALAVAGPALFAVLVHFGKAGYVNAYLPGLVLLLLLPWAGAARRPLAVATAVVAVAGGVQLLRWATAPAVLPLSRQSSALWFTQARYGWPYPLTRGEVAKTDRETSAYLALAERFDPATDVLVYVLPNGGYRFRHATLTLPAFTAHYVVPPVDSRRVTRGRVEQDQDGAVEVPPGGRAVWVLDLDPPEMAGLAAAGLLRVEEVGGRRVWVAEPGAVVHGVAVVEEPPG